VSTSLTITAISWDATTSLSLADYSFVGENWYDRAGYSVSSAGDVNGDGLDDLLVGANGNDDGGSYAGKAYLILGASRERPARARVVPSPSRTYGGCGISPLNWRCLGVMVRHFREGMK
jgi:hypothetical protein